MKTFHEVRRKSIEPPEDKFASQQAEMVCIVSTIYNVWNEKMLQDVLKKIVVSLPFAHVTAAYFQRDHSKAVKSTPLKEAVKAYFPCTGDRVSGSFSLYHHILIPLHFD